MTHIENSDRGITLSKSLAWTVLVAIIGASVWFGSTLSSLQSQSTNTAAAMSEVKLALEQERLQRSLLANRIGALERTEARVDQRLQNIEAGVSRILLWVDNERAR